jgi:hypothetical protein
MCGRENMLPALNAGSAGERAVREIVFELRNWIR